MREIIFYFTGKNFPPISITGKKCALNCKHCGRRMLENLYYATTNEELVNLALKFEKKKAKGILLTGGCNSSGKVPITKFAKAIEKIKKETNLILLAHTGIINFEEAKILKEAGLDGVSLDIVADENVTQKIYGIRIPKEEYKNSLISLKKAKIDIISPHICVGLNFGNLSHELDSLKLVSTIKPKNLIIIALMPLKGTEMENVNVNPRDVAMVFKEAKKLLPGTRIVLGCAHSTGENRAKIEELVLPIVDGIALPTPRIKKIAQKSKMSIIEQKTCCDIPRLER